MKKTIVDLRFLGILAVCSVVASCVSRDAATIAKAKKTEPVYVAANNGKVISEDGHQRLSETDFISIRVRRDTIFFTLKEDALKRLDADPTKNYKQEKTNNKKKRK